MLGGGTIAGIGFTVSLFIATIAFDGAQLDEAKAGVLASGLVAASVTWILFRMTARLPRPVRARVLLGSAETSSDLYLDVDPERDHIRGPVDAPVTLVEYGDFECPYCGLAEPAVRDLLRSSATSATCGATCRSAMCTRTPSSPPRRPRLRRARAVLGDARPAPRTPRRARPRRPRSLCASSSASTSSGSRRDLRTHAGAARVADDVDSADLSGVTGTPTFFVNGRRHYGAYDLETLSNAVRLAGARAVFTKS